MSKTLTKKGDNEDEIFQLSAPLSSPVLAGLEFLVNA